MVSKADRRRYKRHPIENSVSVTSNEICQLINISKGGFRVKCHPYTDVDGFLETDILNPIEQLIGYPAKRVWVSEPKDNNHDLLAMAAGIKFGKLTKEQKSYLAHLISRLSSSSISPVKKHSILSNKNLSYYYLVASLL